MKKYAPPFKVVLVGCGSMANAWVRIAKKHEDLRLVGLVDIRREAALAMAQRHELPPEIVYGSLKEAVTKTGAQLVFDVTVPAAHDKVTIQALKLGCHVLGEKPMSDTLAKARKMVAAARKAKRLYAVTQTRRPLSTVTSVANFVASGALGQLAELHCDFYIGMHFGGFREEMPYPLIADMAIHTFDSARQITDAEPVSVYCHSFNPRHSWYKGDCSAVCVFEMKSRKGQKVVYSYRGSWTNEGLHTSWQATWRVAGSKGTLLWDGEQEIKAQLVEVPGKPGTPTKLADAQVPRVTLTYQGHEGCIRDFVEALKTGRRPMSYCEDNIKTLAMVEAAIKSAKTGKKVKVVW